MTTILHDMILKEYVDDILEKYRTQLEHLNILECVFNHLHHYGLKLNPKKCIFNVTSSKLLGVIISQWGIKIDPKKVKAIMDMPPPQKIK